jgi:hypothetical protein
MPITGDWNPETDRRSVDGAMTEDNLFWCS